MDEHTQKSQGTHTKITHRWAHSEKSWDTQKQIMNGHTQRNHSHKRTDIEPVSTTFRVIGMAYQPGWPYTTRLESDLKIERTLYLRPE